ncbi:MAG: hypothetical protein FWH26_05010 [Oscillospiraceae bacterium]|nr:hypothetical protein [Oscillospiraceae bacterium]
MNKMNSIEEELNRIRLEIYEETKDMSLQERTERVSKIADDAARKYGLHRIASVKNDVAKAG